MCMPCNSSFLLALPYMCHIFSDSLLCPLSIYFLSGYWQVILSPVEVIQKCEQDLSWLKCLSVSVRRCIRKQATAAETVKRKEEVRKERRNTVISLSLQMSSISLHKVTANFGDYACTGALFAALQSGACQVPVR